MAVMAAVDGLDCRNCNEFQKQDRGCLEDSPIPQRWRIGVHESNRCPRRIATIESCEYLVAYQLYREGNFPNGIGWINETNKFLEAMMLIDNIMRENKNVNRE